MPPGGILGGDPGVLSCGHPRDIPDPRSMLGRTWNNYGYANVSRIKHAHVIQHAKDPRQEVSARRTWIARAYDMHSDAPLTTSRITQCRRGSPSPLTTSRNADVVGRPWLPRRCGNFAIVIPRLRMLFGMSGWRLESWRRVHWHI